VGEAFLFLARSAIEAYCIAAIDQDAEHLLDGRRRIQWRHPLGALSELAGRLWPSQ
jgi:hypothetical protein